MEEQILKLIAEINPYVDIEVDSNLLEEEIIDSMSILLLITELEHLYHIQIPLNNLQLEDFCGVRNIVKLVTNLIKHQG